MGISPIFPLFIFIQGGTTINNYYSKALTLENEIQTINLTLKKLPEGKLITSRTGKYYKWFNRIGKAKYYIPKKNRILASQLAYKTLLVCKYNYYTSMKKQLQRLSSTYEQYNLHLTKILSSPCYIDLLSDYNCTNSTAISWINEPYNQNPYHPEKRIHSTVHGILCRSKSESLIAMILSERKIPFRYECELLLDNKTIYPDFTLLNVDTNETIYYEHFGMMDSPRYVADFTDKISLYTSNGIIPGKNLIMTFESSDNPITYDLINQALDCFFPSYT